MRNAAGAVEGGSIGCAVASPPGWCRPWTESSAWSGTCQWRQAINCRIWA